MNKLYVIHGKETNKPLSNHLIKKWEREAGWRVSRHRKPAKKVFFTEKNAETHGIGALPVEFRDKVKIVVYTEET